MEKKVIVISAVSFNSGGPLSILKGVLAYLDKSKWVNEYRIIAIVCDKRLFDCKNIEYIVIPNVQGRWLYRLYLENIYFRSLSKKLSPYLWFSLQITPNVEAERLVVYMHNPSPFYKWKISDIGRGYKYVLYALFYKYIYRLNIKKNSFIVVQQEWLRKAFSKMYHLSYHKFIVAYPFQNQRINQIKLHEDLKKKLSDSYSFFFPAVPRPFKNFEVICEAVKILRKNKIGNFEVFLTLDGTENRYAKSIVRKYADIDNIHFVGFLKQNEVFEYYQNCSCLIFPSKLETWGLPISEFSIYGKPMLIADLPYAHETASGAPLVSFFSPNDPFVLADKMRNLIQGDYSFLYSVPFQEKQEPFTSSWDELFSYILNSKE